MARGAPVIGYEFAIRIDSIKSGTAGREENPGFCMPLLLANVNHGRFYVIPGPVFGVKVSRVS